MLLGPLLAVIDPFLYSPIGSFYQGFRKFSYVRQLGIQAISVNLAYTNPPENENKWPIYWKTSPFAKLWRFWSTCKTQTLTDATDEMNGLNPPGRRQVFANTTIKNDAATLAAAHAAYQNTITSLRRVNVKDLVWTLVFQPFLPEWVRKGDSDTPLGLLDTHEPLVIVSFTANWAEERDDEFVKMITRRTIEEINTFATANGTDHRYRYFNYCSEWQRPFDGYGEENLAFLREVSGKFDPEGFFQRGCTGGFKLGIDGESKGVGKKTRGPV
ncbi:hypothetical protein G7Y89_g15499 [Cudoniella acicularis]|uniref:Berberine/berberine-like domain-containing protein n=1 Tax=Cudoniella acicularis TaxID=354080 RepID=A0A8H4QM30_9HELO|nr:hypothetical protein G7Y89_g15499 [Cudoniella acicularis]